MSRGDVENAMEKSLWRDEDELIMWYRAMGNVDKLSVRAYLNNNDERLLVRVARRVFVARVLSARIFSRLSVNRLA